jgi:3-isopropylmalate dehydrogenase
LTRIVVLPGDGIGPEVTREAQRVLARAASAHGIGIDFEEALIGGASIDVHGTPLTDDVVASCRDAQAVLLGAVGGPKWDDLSVAIRPEKGLLRIRKELGLFANLRPASVFPALVAASSLRPELVEGIDMLVVRELTGGLYFGEPRGIDRNGPERVGRNTMVYSDVEIERIARVAFESAQRRRRQLCTCTRPTCSTSRSSGSRSSTRSQRISPTSPSSTS